MVTIEVEQWFPASRSQVFEHLCDHERFLAAPGLVCRVTTAGSPTKNGLGAIREVRTAGLYFRESITGFEPGESFDYHIDTMRLLGLPLSFKHDRGRLTFVDLANGTRVRWESTLTVNTPLVGAVIERDFHARASHAFSSLLKAASARLSA